MFKVFDVIPSGLIETIEAAGHSVTRSPDGWQCSDDVAVQAIVDGYENSPERLEHHKTLKLSDLTSAFTTTISSGLLYQGRIFQIDAASRANIAAMSTFAISASLGGPWPKDFYWIAADNTHVPMLAQDMLAFGQAVGAYVSALVLKQRSIKDAIAVAADVAVVDLINPAEALSLQ